MVHFELVFPYGMRLRLRPFIYLRMCNDSSLVLWAHVRGCYFWVLYSVPRICGFPATRTALSSLL